MVLPSYLASAAFLWLISRGGDNKGGCSLLAGLAATFYALWLLCAAGPAYLMMSTVLFSLGIIMYGVSLWKHDRYPFEGREKFFALGMVLFAIISLVLFATGKLALS